MQIDNDYDKDVYNGDIGNIDDVDPANGELIANLASGQTPEAVASRRRLLLHYPC